MRSPLTDCSNRGSADGEPEPKEGSPVVSDDDFRMLCARREGQQLDFKERFYENNDKGTAELAKDVMAIANALPIGASGHILFGVREAGNHTGEICGCEIASWITDSNLQQKVRGCLNRNPTFSLFALSLNDVRVLALEITAGGRPFYPLHDKGALRRHVAMVRVGSGTDLASPDNILDWARQDDTLGIRTLEAARLRAEMVIAAAIKQVPGSGVVDGAHVADFEVRNLGEKALEFVGATAIWRYSEQFAQAIGTWPPSIPPPEQPREARASLGDHGAQPGQAGGVRVYVRPSREEATFLSSRPRATQSIPPFHVDLTVRCKNMTGSEKDVSGSGTA